MKSFKQIVENIVVLDEAVMDQSKAIALTIDWEG